MQSEEAPQAATKMVLDRNVSCAECFHTGMLEKRSKKKKYACQVCKFEGRGKSILKDVCWCRKHAIHCCSVAGQDKELNKADGSPVMD